jgi:PD-(D/E)XK nuclease superfamily protein
MEQLSLRFLAVRAEWHAILQPAPDHERFEAIRREARRLVDAGQWTSGPSDLLSILGRQRDELVHSRMLAWLLVPTNRHGLGRRFLTAFLDGLWPDESLLQSGSVTVDTEVTQTGLDDVGAIRAARADIVLRGEGLTVVIENKLDAGEGLEQCERLYWAWAAEAGETRWVFLSATGRAPVTATTDVARAAWRTLSYAQVREILATAIDAASGDASIGRSTVVQYLASLTTSVAHRP